MSEDSQNFLLSLDGDRLKQYIADKVEIVRDMKDKSLFLAGVYGDCIKIEIDVNPKTKSVKMSIKEYV